MVFNLLINLFSYLTVAMDIVTPSYKMPEATITAIGGVLGYFGFYNGFLPIGHGLMIFGYIVLFEATLIGFRLLVGIISIVRGGGNIDV